MDMGVLERALSKRVGLSTAAAERADPLDTSKHLEHIADEQLDKDVTASSVAAMTSFLQYRASVRNLAPPPAPAFGAGESGGLAEEDAKEGEEGGGGGSSSSFAGEGDEEDSDEEPDAPPLQRGIVSSQGISHGGSSGGGGSYSRGAEVEEVGPGWEPNMELELAEFEQDSVTYLAEGAMCQCFRARKLPPSMNIPTEEGGGNGKPNAIFEGARSEGVIIKTPTEGPNQQMSENDLVIESLVLRELRHPNIVGILGGGKTHTGSSFLCLEYLSGGTLRGRLDKCGGGLGVGPAVKYGMQLSSALAYMHDGYVPGIILMHRDLKPDNIGFSSDGMAKLMDFGLAKIIHRTIRCGSVKYNMTGETGSPRYMPPEVATMQPYNEKADVWSFIIILWEMVAGRLPFAGMSMDMYIENVCNGPERPLVQNQWPADLKSLLRSSWQRDPDKRPSFREIHAVLSGMYRDMNKPKQKTSFFRKK